MHATNNNPLILPNSTHRQGRGGHTSLVPTAQPAFLTVTPASVSLVSPEHHHITRSQRLWTPTQPNPPPPPRPSPGTSGNPYIHDQPPLSVPITCRQAQPARCTGSKTASGGFIILSFLFPFAALNVDHVPPRGTYIILGLLLRPDPFGFPPGFGIEPGSSHVTSHHT